MQTIGERLEEARKRKGSSIREAAEATKIRGDYLQKFEANSFDIGLPPLYVRGFVRAYARYLELDADRFIAEYDSAMAAEGRTPRRETREVYGRVDFGGGEAGGTAPAPGAMNQALVLKYSLFGGGALVLVIVIYVLISVLSSHTAAKPATPAQTAAAQAAANPPADGSQTLTFTATDTTRLKIVQDSDKHPLFDGALNRGETKSFRKVGKLLITVEHGASLRMEVNGRNYPIPLDGYGRFALD
ncbi:MAG: helix-turn-helix domain-containing protein [Opitutales bacterium]